MQHYVHSIDPFAIQFTETFGIRWYGLAYLTGFALAYYSMIWLGKKGRIQPTAEKIGDLITYGAIGTMVGGRLGYCIFYSPELLTSFTSDFPFWGVLAVHKGGMASHGGLAGVIVACLLFAKRNNYSGMHIIDLCVFGGGLGIFFGRIANFINGELYGRQASDAFKWAVKFPQEIYRWNGGQKEQLKSLGGAVEHIKPFQFNGQMLQATADQWSEWVTRYDHISRAYIDAFKEQIVLAAQYGQQNVLTALQTALTPRHASQIYQAFLEGLFVVIILFLVWKKPQKPGVISALFGCFYAIARIIGEQFRMPDAHIGYDWLGLSRGQWLSVAMLALCLGYLWYALKQKDSIKLGGWGQDKKSA